MSCYAGFVFAEGFEGFFLISFLGKTIERPNFGWVDFCGWNCNVGRSKPHQLIRSFSAVVCRWHTNLDLLSTALLSSPTWRIAWFWGNWSAKNWFLIFFWFIAGLEELLLFFSKIGLLKNWRIRHTEAWNLRQETWAHWNGRGSEKVGWGWIFWWVQKRRGMSILPGERSTYIWEGSVGEGTRWECKLLETSQNSKKLTNFCIRPFRFDLWGQGRVGSTQQEPQPISGRPPAWIAHTAGNSLTSTRRGRP